MVSITRSEIEGGINLSKFDFDKKFNLLNDGKCIIEQCISKFDEDESEKENTVRRVFSDPNNSILEVVLTKVVVLNEFYSTQLNSNKPKELKPGQTYHMDVISMAHHIVAWKQFSEYCNSQEKEKRQEAVAYLSGLSEKKSDYFMQHHKKAYSFATKYCSWHNPNHYPIVDSFSKGMLYYLNKEFGFFRGKIKQEDLNTYSVFCDVYEALQEYLKKECNKYYSFRDIDKFLWYYGKINRIAI